MLPGPASGCLQVCPPGSSDFVDAGATGGCESGRLCTRGPPLAHPCTPPLVAAGPRALLMMRHALSGAGWPHHLMWCGAFAQSLVAGMLTPLGPAGGALTTQCGITLTIIAPGPWRVQCPWSTWTPIAWTFARCVGCWWRAGSTVFIPDVAHVPASSYLTIGPPA